MVIGTWLRPAGAALASHVRTLRDDRRLRLLTVAILGINAAMILTALAPLWGRHLLGVELPQPDGFALDEDRAVPEIVAYLTGLLTAGLLLAAGLRRRSAWLAFFSLLFLVFVADDALRYHEVVGHLVARVLDYRPALGLRPQDLGELTAWALAGAALLVPFALAMRRRFLLADGEATVLALLCGALVFCAMGLDVIQSNLAPGRLTYILGIAEDGGEIMLIALACCYAAGLEAGTRRGRRCAPAGGATPGDGPGAGCR